MKLKTWQKWGIVFGVIHIICALALLYLENKHPEGHPNVLFLLYVADFPVSGVSGLFLEKIFNNYGEYHYFSYLLIFGTLQYVLIGAILGIITQRIGRGMHWILKLVIISCGIYLFTVLLTSNKYEWCRLVVLFIVCLVSLLVGISSLMIRRTRQNEIK